MRRSPATNPPAKKFEKPKLIDASDLRLLATAGSGDPRRAVLIQLAYVFFDARYGDE